jgi:hypothetical protein
MKKAVPVIVALAIGILIGMFLATKIFGPDRAYWIERTKYDADVAAQERKTNAALAVVAEKDALIVGKDEDLAARETRIDELEEKAVGAALERDALAKETAVLKADAAAAIAANPVVRALVDNYELRLAASDRQIFTLTATLEEERAAKGDWIAKYDAAVVQRDEYKALFENEHQLRLDGDALRLGLEKKLYGGKFWKWVALGEPVAFGLVLIFGGKG